MRTLQEVTAKYNVTKDSIMEQALQMAPVKIPQKPAITSNPSPNKRAAPKSVTESPLPKKIRTVATLEQPANTYRVPHLNKPALGSLAGEVLSEIGAVAYDANAKCWTPDDYIANEVKKMVPVAKASTAGGTEPTAGPSQEASLKRPAVDAVPEEALSE
ncbi:MAG: hypothetical protein M1815_005813 [Lichina confinis]|nr:MAG: hypothetical protein M1815_005813 [Lichina confinis]